MHNKINLRLHGVPVSFFSPRAKTKYQHKNNELTSNKMENKKIIEKKKKREKKSAVKK